MVEKFQEFDEYQLGKVFHELSLVAKYNRIVGETSSKRRKKGDSLKSMKIEKPTFTVTLKKMIRFLHISYPVNAVMSLLGKTYPTSASDFIASGLTGEWDPNLSGTRMRLPVPYTWETELSKTQINEQRDVWQNLIGKLFKLQLQLLKIVFPINTILKRV